MCCVITNFVVAVKPQVPEKAPAGSGSGFNQILGIKGAKQETVRPLHFCFMYCN